MKERKIDRINSVTAAKAKQCVTMKYRQQWQRQNNNNNMQASKQPNNNNNKNNRQIVYLYMTNGCERYIAITHNIARRFRFVLVVESFSWCNCMQQTLDSACTTCVSKIYTVYWCCCRYTNIKSCNRYTLERQRETLLNASDFTILFESS